MMLESMRELKSLNYDNLEDEYSNDKNEHGIDIPNLYIPLAYESHIRIFVFNKDNGFKVNKSNLNYV